MTSAKQRFLDYYKEARSKGTHKSYKRGLALFEEYYGKSCDLALEERKQDTQSKENDILKKLNKTILLTTREFFVILFLNPLLFFQNSKEQSWEFQSSIFPTFYTN